MNKIKALLQIIWPELPIAAGVCVVVGQVIAQGKFPPMALIALGFGLGFFLSSSAMVFNDIFDLEVDRVNAPKRPLPSGMLTKPEAIAWGLCLGVVGLILAAIIAQWPSYSPWLYGSWGSCITGDSNQRACGEI